MENGNITLPVIKTTLPKVTFPGKVLITDLWMGVCFLQILLWRQRKSPVSSVETNLGRPAFLLFDYFIFCLFYLFIKC